MKDATHTGWVYFFGGTSGRRFDRYYTASIDGISVEQHSSNRGTVYSIGNIDKAKIKYKTESELITAVKAVIRIKNKIASVQGCEGTD